jgi:hypothetical protein
LPSSMFLLSFPPSLSLFLHSLTRPKVLKWYLMMLSYAVY